jgi:2-oxo-3-hexenedioate decarboxylase/2-keto-4-pentenoate hydratase
MDGPSVEAMESIQDAAEMLARHRHARKAFPGFPDNLRPQDDDDAYSVQEALHKILTRQGLGALVGHKIGCTTPTMQAYLGIDRPAAGGVLATTVRHIEGRFAHADFVCPGVECELAVRLGTDLEPTAAPFGRADIEEAVESVMAAIEVVDDRYRDWGSLDAPTLIADDFFGAGCVLGPEERDWLRLDLVGMSARMTVNGVEVGSGSGGDILGDPLRALVWLANELARRSCLLSAGTFVLLGSLVQTHWVRRGDIVIVDNTPLGTVTARFD